MKRGEIWLIDFDPSRGAEIQKPRPAIIVNSDSVGRLPLRIVVPICGWQDTFTTIPWMIPIEPDPHNHLDKRSAIDTFQIRSLSQERFRKFIGNVSPAILHDICEVLKMVLDMIDPLTGELN